MRARNALYEKGVYGLPQAAQEIRGLKVLRDLCPLAIAVVAA